MVLFLRARKIYSRNGMTHAFSNRFSRLIASEPGLEVSKVAKTQAIHLDTQALNASGFHGSLSPPRVTQFVYLAHGAAVFFKRHKRPHWFRSFSSASRVLSFKSENFWRNFPLKPFSGCLNFVPVSLRAFSTHVKWSFTFVVSAFC